MKRSVETGHQASSRTHQAGESLKQIVESVGTIRDQSTMIATAVEQQASAAGGINENIHKINELSENTADTVDTTHSQSTQLAQLAQLSESLRLSVQKFLIPN